MNAPLVSSVLLLASLLTAGAATRARTRERVLARLGPHVATTPGRETTSSAKSRLLRWSLDPRLTAVALGLAGALAGWHLAGPPGSVVLGGAGAWGPVALSRRGAGRRRELLDSQLAELADGLAMGLRSGLSIPQAFEYSAGELDPPLADEVDRLVDGHRLGIPFEEVLARFGDAVGTDDARLLVLVVGIHARSGGDLAAAIEEVVATIRHRVAVRRELRGLTAQGRLSGAILGIVPLVFFLFLAITSRRDLMPVYRSPAGLAMVGGGLLLEALAYLWIRRLLRVGL